MAQKLSKQDFNSQGRRICFVETEDKNTVLGKITIEDAKSCPHRIPEAVEFTDKELAGILGAECTHPEQKSSRLTNFCEPMKRRVEREPN